MKTPVALASLVVLMACSGVNTMQVSTRSVPAGHGELFQVKNALAEQTANPQSARFQTVSVFELSNGDRVYCGQMNAQNGFGTYEGFTPFYLRRNATQIKAVHVASTSADFSARKCAEARTGSLKVAPI